ncbi:Phenylalanine ammonia-lyase 3 [Bienertia sinuspersici]
MREYRNRMEKLMGETQTNEVIAQLKALDDRMDELEHREELYWRQRSRQDWLRNGDKNTSFFNAKAQQCCKRNNINKIKDLAGNSYDEEETDTKRLQKWLRSNGKTKSGIAKLLKPFSPPGKLMEFMVKSAYNVLAIESRSGIATSSNNAGEFDWQRIWNAKVSQEIKMFAWRAVRGGIPTKAQLGRCGLESWCVKLLGRYKDPYWLRGVARDWLGDVVVATSKKLLGHYSAETVKAMALRHAMSITMEAGFKNIVGETDNLKLSSHLSKEKTDHLSYGSIIKDIKLLSRECQCISFTFVKREGNKVAHKMARLSCNYAEYRVWLEEFPMEA